MPDERQHLDHRQAVGQRRVRADLVDDPRDGRALVRQHRDAAGEQRAQEQLDRAIQFSDREELAGLRQGGVVDPPGHRQQEIVETDRQADTVVRHVNSP